MISVRAHCTYACSFGCFCCFASGEIFPREGSNSRGGSLSRRGSARGRARLTCGERLPSAEGRGPNGGRPSASNALLDVAVGATARAIDVGCLGSTRAALCAVVPLRGSGALVPRAVCGAIRGELIDDVFSSRVCPLANRIRAAIGATTGAKLGVGRRLLLLTTGTAGFASGVAAVKLSRLCFLLKGTACSASVALRITSKDLAKPNDPPRRVFGDEGSPPRSPPPSGSRSTHGFRLKEGVGLPQGLPEIREIRETREIREEAWCGEGEGPTLEAGIRVRTGIRSRHFSSGLWVEVQGQG